MAESIQGWTALITGAARRIGRETALTLAEAGVNIVVHYNTSAGPAQELVSEVEGYGVRAWAVQADFDKPAEYQSLIDRALQAAGRLDILVNNASIFPPETLNELTFDSVMKNFEINAWVPFYLSRDFARRVGKGKIVNLIDSRIHGEDWNHVGYILSKHLLEVLTRMCALEFAPNITVNGVGPGLILPPPGKDESYIDKLKNTVPLKQHGDPQDIADAILFFVHSPFVTGDLIFVDGGRHLKEYVGEKNPH